MPVEIKELIIRAVAEEQRTGAEYPPDVPDTDDRKDAIVEACVRQVLRILKKSKER